MRLMKSKDFVLYTLLATTIVLLSYSYIVLNFKMLYMDSDYPVFTHVKNIINSPNKEQAYNFIAIGDSKLKAGFMPKQFDNDFFNSINLSMNGASPIEGFFTLKKYLKNNTPPKYLLLSYSPMALAPPDSEINSWTRNLAFDFYTYSDFKHILETARAIKHDTNLRKNYWFIYKIKTGKYIFQFFKGIFEKRWKSNGSALEKLRYSRGHFFYGKKERSDEQSIDLDGVSKFSPSQLRTAYLEKTLELAIDNQVTVFYYTMPFNETSFNNLHNNPRKQYDQYISKIFNKYSLINLNKLYYLRNEMFGDSMHLYRGIKKVTNEISDKINTFLHDLRVSHEPI